MRAHNESGRVEDQSVHAPRRSLGSRFEALLAERGLSLNCGIEMLGGLPDAVVASNGIGGVNIGDAEGCEYRGERLGLATALARERALSIVLAAKVRTFHCGRMPDEDKRTRRGEGHCAVDEVGLRVVVEFASGLVNGQPADVIDLSSRVKALIRARSRRPEVDVLEDAIERIAD